MSSQTSSVATTLVRSDEKPWKAQGPECSLKVLRSDKETGASTLLIRFEAGASFPDHNHPGGEEVYVLEGRVRIGDHDLSAGDYLYTPPDATHPLFTDHGCLLLVSAPKPIEILAAEPD